MLRPHAGANGDLASAPGQGAGPWAGPSGRAGGWRHGAGKQDRLDSRWKGAGRNDRGADAMSGGPLARPPASLPHHPSGVRSQKDQRAVSWIWYQLLVEVDVTVLAPFSITVW